MSSSSSPVSRSRSSVSAPSSGGAVVAWVASSPDGAVEPQRVGEHHGVGALQRDEAPSIGDLGVVEEVGGVVHGADPARQPGFGDPVGGRPGQEGLGQPCRHRFVGVHAEAMAGHVGDAQGIAEDGPGAGLGGGDRHVAPVGAPVDVAGREGAPRRTRGVGGAADVLGPHPHRAVGHVHVEPRALARALGVVERGEHAGGGEGRGEGDRHDRAGRRRLAVAQAGEQAGVAEVGDVVARRIGVRAEVTEAGDRAPDDLRMSCAHGVVAQPEAVELARPVGLDDEVGPADEPVEHRRGALLAEIEGHGPLPAVQGDVGGVEPAAVHAAEPVARGRRLDLDHVGAEVGEQERAEAAGDHAREVEHVHVAERAAGGVGTAVGRHSAKEKPPLSG